MMPISHLNKKGTRSANIWDITCDSDGEIPFDSKKPLYLHEVDLTQEDYFLGFFLVGAYQDILGMKHNLFSSPSQVNIIFEDGEMKLDKFLKSQSIIEIFDDLDYNSQDILDRLLTSTQNEQLKDILKEYLNDNSYLKTIASKG